MKNSLLHHVHQHHTPPNSHLHLHNSPLQHQVMWNAHCSRRDVKKVVEHTKIAEKALVKVQKKLEKKTEQLEGARCDVEMLVAENQELKEENLELRKKQKELMGRRSSMVGQALQEAYTPEVVLRRRHAKKGHNELQYPPQLRLVTMELLSNGSSAPCVLQHLRTAAHLFRPEWIEGTDHELLRDQGIPILDGRSAVLLDRLHCPI